MTLKKVSQLYFRGYRLKVKDRSFTTKKYTYFRAFTEYKEILRVNISEITEDSLIELQEYLKKRYTNNTGTLVYYTLINIFDFAIKIGLIKKNMARAVKFLKLRRASTVNRVLTEDDFYKMLKHVKDINKRIYLELIFSTGLRSSEARALKWENINFNQGILRVNNSIYCQKVGKYKLILPKTKTSRRTIKIDNITLSLLKKIHEENSINSEFVFHDKDGFPRPINFCVYELKLACKKAKVFESNIHNLRHSHATNMLIKEVPIAMISRRLGHSKTSITEDLYIHLIPNNENLVIDRLQYRNHNALNI